MKIEQNPFLIALANQASEALIILDAELKVLLFNDSAKKIFGPHTDLNENISFILFCKNFTAIDFENEVNITMPSLFEILIKALSEKTKINWAFEEFYENKTFIIFKTVGLEENDNQNKIFQLETLIDNMPCNVYWVDRECRMINCNQNVLNMLQISKEDFKGKTYEDLALRANWPKGLAEKLQKDDLFVMNSGIPIYGIEDPPMPHADGAVSNFLTSRVPLKNRNGDILGIAGISTDVTALKDARSKSEAASHAKSAFIANMSHDLRTPLTGVIGLSGLLETELDNPTQKEEAHLLHDSGEELLHMLNDILEDIKAGDISEHELHNEKFSLYKSIDELIKLERPTIKIKNLELKAELDAKIPQYISSDRKKINRILLNLLGNAIKFTQSGTISINVSFLGMQENKLHINFAVSDTGIGIPEDMREKVFERFFKVSPSYKGVYSGYGLGLSIAQTYVQLLGGTIGLTSEVGKGTTFYFDILCEPAVIDENRQENQVEINQNSHKDLNLRLLIVEDNLMALKVLETLVQKLGHSYESADTGEKALLLLEKFYFDLIITDIGLPGISGTDFASKVRLWEKEQNRAEQIIIGLTGHAKESAYEECINSGMNDVYTKPADAKIINQIINKYISHINVSEERDTKNKVKGLGLDLPMTENELFEIEKHPLFDIKSAMRQIPDLSVLIPILKDFISESFQNDINELKSEYEKKDWKSIERIAHKIKSGAVYIGTSRLFFACQYLERYHKAGHGDKLDKLYHQVISTNDETIEAVSEWLNIYC